MMEQLVLDSGDLTGFEQTYGKVTSAADKVQDNLQGPLPGKFVINASVSAESLLDQDPFERENTSFVKGDNSFSSNEELTLETFNENCCSSALTANASVDSRNISEEVENSTSRPDFNCSNSDGFLKKDTDVLCNGNQTGAIQANNLVTKETCNTDSKGENEKCNRNPLEGTSCETTNNTCENGTTGFDGSDICVNENNALKIETDTSVSRSDETTDRSKVNKQTVDDYRGNGDVMDIGLTVSTDSKIVGCDLPKEKSDLPCDQQEMDKSRDSSNMASEVQEVKKDDFVCKVESTGKDDSVNITNNVSGSNHIVEALSSLDTKSKAVNTKCSKLDNDIVPGSVGQDEETEKDKPQCFVDSKLSSPTSVDKLSEDSNERKLMEMNKPKVEKMEVMENPELGQSKQSVESLQTSKLDRSKLESKMEECPVFENVNADVDLKKESVLVSEEGKVILRKRFFSGEKRESSSGKTVLVKDRSNAETMNDVYCFDGSDESFNGEKDVSCKLTVSEASSMVSKVDVGRGDLECYKNMSDELKPETKNIPQSTLETTSEKVRKSKSTDIQEFIAGETPSQKHEKVQPKTLESLRNKVTKNISKVSVSNPTTENLITEKDENISEQKDLVGLLVSSAGREIGTSTESDNDINEKPVSDVHSLGDVALKTEQSVPKKRGRKPKSAKIQSLKTDESPIKIPKKLRRKRKKRNIEGVELGASDGMCVIEDTSTPQQVSPTRSGRKSYKKLNKEFVYEHVSSNSESENSPSKRKSQMKHNTSDDLWYSPKKKYGWIATYKCKQCSFETIQKFHFIEHVGGHIGYSPFHCNVCEFKTSRRTNARRHCENLHSNKKAFHYEKIDETEHIVNDTLRDALVYVPSKLTFKKSQSSPKKKLNTHSGKTFDLHAEMTSNADKNLSKHTENDLDMHTKMNKGTNSDMNTESTNETNIESDTESKTSSTKMLKCPLCSYCSQTEMSIRRHAMWKHYMCKYHCPKCDFNSVFKKEVMAHYRKGHGKGYCSPMRHFGMTSVLPEVDSELGNDATFSLVEKSGEPGLEKANLKVKRRYTRKMNKSDEKCRLCGFKTDSVVGLKRHMFFRHRLCNWLCKRCSSTFSCQEEAVKHSVTSHHGESPIVSRILTVEPYALKTSENASDDVPVRKLKGKKQKWNFMKTKRKILLDSSDFSLERKEVDGDPVGSTETSGASLQFSKSPDTDISTDDVQNFAEKSVIKSSVTKSPSELDCELNDNIQLERRKPGRPKKTNKMPLNMARNLKLLAERKAHKLVPSTSFPPKRGKKRKLEIDTKEKSQQISSEIATNFRKKQKVEDVLSGCRSDLNLSVGMATDIQKCDVNSSDKQTIDMNESESYEQMFKDVLKKKRGPKKKIISCPSPSQDKISEINECSMDIKSENQNVISEIRQKSQNVLAVETPSNGQNNEHDQCFSDDLNHNQTKIKSNIKLITTVADVHSSDTSSGLQNNENSVIRQILNSNKSNLKTYRILSPKNKPNPLGSGEKKQYSHQNFTVIKGYQLSPKRSKVKTISSLSGSEVISSDARFKLNSGVGKKKYTFGNLPGMKKRGPKKKVEEKLPECDELFTKWKSSSYVLHPKKLKNVKFAYSCPYCDYAAPLRHQLRLHCYGKHTDRPACLIEFKNQTNRGRPKGSKNKKPVILENGSKPSDSSVTIDHVNDSPVTMLSEKTVSDAVKSSPTKSPVKRKRVKRRYRNPIKSMVKKLNKCRVRLYDPFYACVDIDDIDKYLDKFGVRTLNMDLLTQKQFQQFMSKFGGNLQGVDL